MDKTTMNALTIAGSTIAGGALGTWAGAKLGANYGLRAGPWGALAGALVGALVGAALTNVLSQSEAPEQVQDDIL